MNGPGPALVGDRPDLVLATDLDGTVAFDARPPAPEILALLEQLAHGCRTSLVVATSRAPRSVRGWFGPLADRIDLICCNGGLVLTRGIEKSRRALPPILVAAMVEALDAAAAPYCLEYGDQFLASNRRALPWMGSIGRHDRWPGETPRWDGVLKLSVAHADPWAARLAAMAAGEAEVFAHHTGDADVVAAGVSKASALDELFAAEQQIVAFGNDANDRQMLTRATRSVVVGGELPELDAFAHVRRIPPTDDAVAGALRAELTRREAVDRCCWQTGRYAPSAHRSDDRHTA